MRTTATTAAISSDASVLLLPLLLLPLLLLLLLLPLRSFAHLIALHREAVLSTCSAALMGCGVNASDAILMPHDREQKRNVLLSMRASATSPTSTPAAGAGAAAVAAASAVAT